jgi:hypothetical protein
MIFEGVEKALEPQTFTSPKVSQNPNNSESYREGYPFHATLHGLILVLMDANLDCGAPATVGVALLGERVIAAFDIPVTVAIADFDSYPFSSVLRTASGDTRREILRIFDSWPPVLRERALRTVNGKTH